MKPSGETNEAAGPTLAVPFPRLRRILRCIVALVPVPLPARARARNLPASGPRDGSSNAGKGYGYTAGFPFLRIDHILVSPEIGVGDCFIGSAQASPHRPVIADLYLNS